MAALTVTFDTFAVSTFSLSYDGTSVVAFLAYQVYPAARPELALVKSRQQIITPGDISTKTLAQIYNAAVAAAKAAEGL